MTTFFDANIFDPTSFYYTTRKSATGIIHLYNKTPIDWYSSKNPVECAAYSTEFTSMKIAVEHIIANRIELRYFGWHIDGSAHLFVDNKSVIDTSMYPSYR